MGRFAAEAREFVLRIRPVLERQDSEALVEYLARNVTNEQLCRMVRCGEPEAVKVALFCLAWVGTMKNTPDVARGLQSEDAPTAALAEHALWSIWLRQEDPLTNADLHQAVGLIAEGRLDAAISVADRVLERCPDFAEAYNQRAIAHFLKGDYASAIEDCEEVIQRNPYHFGALAGLGHSHALLGDLEEALSAYGRALRLHPSMDGLRESIGQIRERLAHSPVTDSLPFSKT